MMQIFHLILQLLKCFKNLCQQTFLVDKLQLVGISAYNICENWTKNWINNCQISTSDEVFLKNTQNSNQTSHF